MDYKPHHDYEGIIPLLVNELITVGGKHFKDLQIYLKMTDIFGNKYFSI